MGISGGLGDWFAAIGGVANGESACLKSSPFPVEGRRVRGQDDRTLLIGRRFDREWWLFVEMGGDFSHGWIESALEDAESELAGGDGGETENAFEPDVGACGYFFPLAIDVGIECMFLDPLTTFCDSFLDEESV